MGKIIRGLIMLGGIGVYLSYLINFILGVESVYMMCIIAVIGVAFLSVIVTTFSRSVISGVATAKEENDRKNCRKI